MIFTKLSQSYHTVFTNEKYNIDNERGSGSVTVPLKNYECYAELAAAIVEQALQDFKKDEKYRSEVIRFIKSDWFKTLSQLDSERILQFLKEYERNEKNRT